MSHRRVVVMSLFALAAFLLPVATAFGDDPPAADYDAVYVGMKVPDKVVADEVFSVQITMKNTGAKPWASWPLRLRTIDPENNMTWGTSYIIVAQGKTVTAGQEYTFSSKLRAPSQPGSKSFQWQVCRDGKDFFGQSTPARTVEVVARTEPNKTSRPPAERTSDGKRVLAFEDFEYVGSFKPPMTVGKARGAFSEVGLALRKMPAVDHLFINYTHPTRMLFEVEIPELVKIVGGQHAPLKTAEVKKEWGAPSASRDGTTIGPNDGFLWDEGKRTLYWTWYHGYKTGGAPPVLAASKLAEDGTMTTAGPWYVSVKSGLYKGYWGGVVRLPEAFAAKYTDGKTLALGFGGYYSICGSASRGPALGAIPEPDPNAKDVPVTELLVSANKGPAPRDGEYFSANCGYWNDDPPSRTEGKWTFDDHCHAGAFVDTPTGHAVIFFPRLGNGRLGYDFGAITHGGESQWWYCYDPADLGAAAKGVKKPTEIAPASMAKADYPLGGQVTGAAWDAAKGLLYLCTVHAYSAGRESYPIIHAYRVKP